MRAILVYAAATLVKMRFLRVSGSDCVLAVAYGATVCAGGVLCLAAGAPEVHKAPLTAAQMAGVAPLAAPREAQVPPAEAQAEPAKPVVVQPGAPGKPSKTLPSSTKGTVPPLSPADVKFMQGMIMHHAQAVEMTALIASHTANSELRTLGARISRSQSDEIQFMKRWLAARGEPVDMAMASGSAATGRDSSTGNSSGSNPGAATGAMHEHNMDMAHGAGAMTMGLMPGMLSPEQMEALRKAKGAEFDRLFLSGMIQHHNGALIMVKDMFDTAGAGQDAELFNFATDVDTGQRAEIRVMQGMLEREVPGKTKEEKR